MIAEPELVAWRLDPARHKGSWDSSIGAAMAGGRWNLQGVHAVYCALDPATAIIEVAVGDDLLATHGILVIPSAISSHSWSLIFLAGTPRGAYRLRRQERFALDSRLAA